MALQRGTASPGDSIYVTGTLGDAGAALLGMMGELKLTGPQKEKLYSKLNRPEPRLAVGSALSGIASACIDISDGLAADVGHLIESGSIGATLYVEQLPLSSSYREIFDLAGGWNLPLHAGDDYELCFTVADDKLQRLEDISSESGVSMTCIGMIDSSPGLKLMMPDGTTSIAEPAGYDHFR
jgi:thiamine-monophosphate kinase